MYQKVRLLGQGYFGEVWLENDLALERPCAAKYLNGPGSSGILDPFAEARSMLQSEHDHVVSVYSAENEGGVPVIRMEYLPAGSVADQYHGGPLSVESATTAAEDACRGLECLHSRGLLHRDLKPANLMVTPTGSVKVSDFGLACKKDQASLAPIGYAPHLPPEVLPDPGYIDSVEGDVYAMGVTLYRLLNGDKILQSLQNKSNADVEDLIISGALPPRGTFEPHVHNALRRVVRKALQLDPTKRYQAASEMRHAIEAARPKVSWRIIADGPDWGWEGVNRVDDSTWKAELNAAKGGFDFKLERRRSGKS